MTPRQPLVSVVTPVYNGAEYLVDCIESVVVGPIENQNRAVREISPESRYTKVLHADDWLFPECLERMVDLAESNPTVGVVSAYRLEETRVTLDGLPHSITVLPGREVARSTLLANPYPFLFGSPSSVLIRSYLIRARNPFYSEDNPWNEDTEACLESLKVSDFGFVHQVLTFSRRPEAHPSLSTLVSAPICLARSGCSRSSDARFSRTRSTSAVSLFCSRGTASSSSRTSASSPTRISEATIAPRYARSRLPSTFETCWRAYASNYCGCARRAAFVPAEARPHYESRGIEARSTPTSASPNSWRALSASGSSDS